MRVKAIGQNQGAHAFVRFYLRPIENYIHTLGEFKTYGQWADNKVRSNIYLEVSSNTQHFTLLYH